MNDQYGHGTFVAGEIAAIADNGAGIAGLAPPARLVIAKVVKPDGTIPPRAEARAIRWAVQQHARVINLSFGSVRDPANGVNDGYSSAERRAIEYAVRRGVLVVAAVGNGTDAPSRPWPYASYPARSARLGVSTYGKAAVSDVLNRDGQYVISAPGMTWPLFPRSLTKNYPECVDRGYSVCGTKGTAPNGHIVRRRRSPRPLRCSLGRSCCARPGLPDPANPTTRGLTTAVTVHAGPDAPPASAASTSAAMSAPLPGRAARDRLKPNDTPARTLLASTGR